LIQEPQNEVVMEAIAWISILAAFACAVIIAADELRHPQHMWIMNLVWPITALYFSVFGLWGLFRPGQKSDARHEPHG
jgi:hypothetical protein